MSEFGDLHVHVINLSFPPLKKCVFLVFISPEMSDFDYTDLNLCKVCHCRGALTFFGRSRNTSLKSAIHSQSLSMQKLVASNFFVGKTMLN